MKISNIMKIKQQDGSFEDVKISYIEPNYCTAEGSQTIALGYASHAEGERVTALGSASHAEGASMNSMPDTITSSSTDDEIITAYNNSGGFLLAKGQGAHAEGGNTLALGSGSHAEGDSTIASGYASHVQGKYNIPDTENNYAFIIGNGEYNNRSNALAVKWNGDVVIKNNALPLSPVYSGYVTATSIGEIAANGYTDVTIDFPAEFFYDGNQPIVTPSLVHTNPESTPYLSVTVPDRKIVNEIGTATIRIFNTYSKTVKPGLQYTVTPCLNIK